jgi:DNA-binding winged helix-turn-helix (wHTH) protein
MRPRETDMLIYLAERTGLAIPQQMLYLDIWQKVYMEIGSNPVSAAKHRMITGLRKHNESVGEDFTDFIETSGNCYTFRPELLLNLAQSPEFN